MEKRKGQVVINTLVTPTTDKKFPVVDSNDISGGRYLAKTISERNKIPPALRRAGMLCYVEETDTDYKLLLGFPEKTNLSDDNWEVFVEPVEEIEFPHQKVEEMQYASETTEGFTTLIEKLNDIDAELDKKIEEYQAVETMTYVNSIDGYTSLIEHLKYLSAQIKNLKNGSNLLIENINYQFVPNDGHNHAQNLGDELEQLYNEMNNADKIIITTNGERSSLKSKIALFEQSITDMNQPGSIMVGDEESLTERLATINTALDNALAAAQGAVQSIEQITYAETPQGRKANLKEELDDLFSGMGSINQVLNKPDEIVVGKVEGEVDGEPGMVDVSLTTKLSEIAVALTTLRNSFKIENITWRDTPENHEDTLTNELTSIYNRINNINTSLSNLQSSSGNDITAIQSTISDIQLSISTINTTLEDMNDPTKITVAEDKNLSTKLGEIDDSLNSINDRIYIEEIGYKEQPVDHQPQTLLEELMFLYREINDINLVLNKPESIIVDTEKEESLTNRLVAINTSITAINESISNLQSSGSSAGNDITAIQATISDIQSDISTINTTLEDMNDPTKITVAEDKNLSTKLGEIDNSLGDMNDPSKIIVDGNEETLTQRLSSIENSFTTTNGNIENVNTTLGQRITAAETTLEDMNDPSKIVVGTKVENEESINVSLSDKLVDINNSLNGLQIAAQGAVQSIEQITYAETPQGRKANLKEELDDLFNGMGTNRTDIDNLETSVSGINTTIEEMQAAIDGLNVSEIVLEGEAGQEPETLSEKLASIDATLADMNDPSKIVVNGENETLALRLTDINDNLDQLLTATQTNSSAIGGLATRVTNLETNSTENNTAISNLESSVSVINTTLEDMNDPTKITVAEDKNLSTKLGEIDNTLSTLQIAAQGAVQSIEQITYAETPQGRNQGLKNELDTLFNSVDSINTTLEDMNDPTKITVAEDKNLSTKLGEIDNSLADMNDPTKITVAEDKNLSTKLGEIDNSLNSINDPTKITVAENESLADRLTDINNDIVGLTTTTADMNDPSKIIVDGNEETLTQRLSSIGSDITTVETRISAIPRFLLFGTSNLSVGVLKGQEYLVDQECNITEVTLYTDAGASLAGNIQIKLQVAAAGGTYNDIGTYTLAADATNLISATTLQTPEVLAVNSRLRVYIVSTDDANEINSFSVRIKTVANN